MPDSIETMSPMKKLAYDLKVMAGDLTAEQGMLTQRFVENRSHRFVISRTKDRLKRTPNPTDRKHLIESTAAVTTHQRLSYLWLVQEREDDNTTILSPGSSMRVSRFLREVAGPFFVDGMIIDRTPTPKVTAFCEYLLGPDKPNDQAHMLELLRNLVAFRDRFEDQEFKMSEPMDNFSGIGRHFALRGKPEIIVVLSAGRQANMDAGVTVLNTPFPFSVIQRIGDRCVQHLTKNVG